MKLGSIVGIILSCVLIIAGIVMCTLGTNEAKDNGQYLFTQRSNDGTQYTQKIDEGTTRIKIECDNAKVTVVGGADKSCIEFNNFNPNYYSLSATPNVITFEEKQEFDSIVDIWENGINFKGLRYALDFRNYGYDSLEKSITINVGNECDIKVLDISTASGSVEISNLELDGDVSLDLKSGKVTLDNVSSTSAVSISGDAVNTTVKNTSALSFRFTVKSSELLVEESDLTDVQVTLDSGRVDYHSKTALDKLQVSIVSESGGLLVNSLPHNSAIFAEPEEYEGSLKIKCVSAGINLTYPEPNDTAETEDTTDTE